MAKTTGQALSKRHCASPFSTTGKNNVAPGIIHGIPERLSEFRRYVRRGSPPRCAPQSPPLVGHGVLDDTLRQGCLLPCASLAHPLLTLDAACASFFSVLKTPSTDGFPPRQIVGFLALCLWHGVTSRMLFPGVGEIQDRLAGK